MRDRILLLLLFCYACIVFVMETRCVMQLMVSDIGLHVMYASLPSKLYYIELHHLTTVVPVER